MRQVLKPGELARYADTIVKGCLDFRRGEDLIIRADPAHRELTVALTEAAYRAGARTVDVSGDDPRVQAARYRLARNDAIGEVAPWQLAHQRGLIEPTTALAQISGDSEPEALANLSPERIAADVAGRVAKMPWYTKARREGKFRATIAPWPTEHWASKVYPELEPLNAQRKLAREILSFCRIAPGDPPGHKGWTAHLSELRRRSARLTKLGLERLEVRAPGTRLDLRLHPEGVWAGGGEVNGYGRRIAMNVPTEECFTTPEAAATEGTFRCTRPRVFHGREIEGLAGEFRRGRLVRLEAKRASDRDFLAAYIAATPDADRLGEIALVDRSSRIGRTGRIFYNGLLDENAVAHMALGSGFEKTRVRRPRVRGTRGVNQSRMHLDVMIGSDELEATGITAKGRRVPLIADGAWQI
jgi:aminopeptidase